MGWNKKWQNCHMNFHQIRWSYHHLNYHQFRQIPPKITIIGEIKSDKIVTRFVNKFGDIFVTLILTISGSSPKNHHIGWNNKWQNRHPKCHQIWWQFRHLNSHQFRQFTEIFTRMGDNPAENPIENVLGLLPPFFRPGHLLYYFLAVHNSSIGAWSLGLSDPTNNQSLHNITEWP